MLHFPADDFAVAPKMQLSGWVQQHSPAVRSLIVALRLAELVQAALFHSSSLIFTVWGLRLMLVLQLLAMHGASRIHMCFAGP